MSRYKKREKTRKSDKIRRQVKQAEKPRGVAAVGRAVFRPLQVLKYIRTSIPASWGFPGADKAGIFTPHRLTLRRKYRR